MAATGFGLLVEQIAETIVHLVIQAPNLAQMMSRMYFLRKVCYPAENPRWPPFFKMAALSNAPKKVFKVELE